MFKQLTVVTRGYILAGIVLLSVIIISALAVQHYMLKEQVSKLNTDKARAIHQLQQYKNKLQELRADNIKAKMDYAQKNKKENINKYKAWKKSKQVAEAIYKKSDGRFKKDWARFMAYQAYSKGIDPYLVYGLLKVESGNSFDPKIVGPETKYGRAYGMAQFMENTAPWIADMAGLKYDKKYLYNPYYSIMLSITYLDYLYGKYHNWNKALTAYNRGTGGMENYVAVTGNAKSEYATKIQTNARFIKEHS
ncbi:transglycosylase-like protein with SLT domain [Scopulibacillus darangshiensis]|uniref:Transglycosylase-like protein with SLT domain n=1 Tax=Scopulibacillus darangshiensis TaxID=442528 RepID=A0A4R2NF34_9BACL|nr:transglycosylase SLT domain-containing protein [Scopulibacillus darangshiensis]TCP19752.1 transglycosylase-like protein with SLT domain [Scopulibacillus darangshiensis]